jgi:transposase
MMGELPPNQNQLFYDFNLEQLVPEDHFLRSIDRFLDFSTIKDLLSDYYSHTGRPSVDPELMIRMLIVGYSYGIRSERRLCEEVQFNLAYRWFCRLGLEDDIPNHSTFSKNRLGRFRDAGLFEAIFHEIVASCIEKGLVKGEGFAVDGSMVRSVASVKSLHKGQIEWSGKQRSKREVREYIEALDESPKHRRRQTTISLTDPMSQWSAAKGPAHFFYSNNYLIDLENSIITDVQASVATYPKEVEALPGMLDRVEEKHGLKPDYLIGDTAYGTAESLHEIVDERDIEPHIPVWDKSNRADGMLSKDSFMYDPEKDIYICPEGHPLKSSGRINKDNCFRYRGKVPTCRACPIKEQCCPNTSYRKVTRHRYESARDKAREITQSDIYQTKSFAARQKVEMAFGHMKEQFGFRRLRLKGMNSANDEFTLMACVQNLRIMARRLPIPPPT